MAAFQAPVRQSPRHSIHADGMESLPLRVATAQRCPQATPITLVAITRGCRSVTFKTLARRPALRCIPAPETFFCVAGHRVLHTASLLGSPRTAARTLTLAPPETLVSMELVREPLRLGALIFMRGEAAAVRQVPIRSITVISI